MNGRGGAGGAVRPYVGRSRFVLTPLTLTLDQLLFLITAALLAFGLIMVQSADSRVREVHENWLMQAFSNKNAIHAGLAAAGDDADMADGLSLAAGAVGPRLPRAREAGGGAFCLCLRPGW